MPNSGKNQSLFLQLFVGKNYYAIPPHVNFDYKYRIDLHRVVVTADNHIYLAGGIYYEDHHLEDSGPALAEVCFCIIFFV